MKVRPQRSEQVIRWSLIYLWSVPLLMLIVHLLDWRHGDPGWLAVLAYAAPVMLLLEPFSGFGLKTSGLFYLAAITIISAAFLWMTWKRSELTR